MYLLLGHVNLDTKVVDTRVRHGMPLLPQGDSEKFREGSQFPPLPGTIMDTIASAGGLEPVIKSLAPGLRIQDSFDSAAEKDTQERLALGTRGVGGEAAVEGHGRDLGPERDVRSRSPQGDSAGEKAWPVTGGRSYCLEGSKSVRRIDTGKRLFTSPPRSRAVHVEDYSELRTANSPLSCSPTAISDGLEPDENDSAGDVQEVGAGLSDSLNVESWTGSHVQLEACEVSSGAPIETSIRQLTEEGSKKNSTQPRTLSEGNLTRRQSQSPSMHTDAAACPSGKVPHMLGSVSVRRLSSTCSQIYKEVEKRHNASMDANDKTGKHFPAPPTPLRSKTSMRGREAMLMGDIEAVSVKEGSLPRMVGEIWRVGGSFVQRVIWWTTAERNLKDETFFLDDSEVRYLCVRVQDYHMHTRGLVA